ncbi:MAG: hypothetical protein RR768_06360 [Clostridium sp.]
MNGFKKFYVWGMNAKLYMGIYFAATVFLMGVVLAVAGCNSIGLWTLVQVLLVDMVIAFFQVWILNEQTDYSRSIFFGRSILWLAISVVLIIGASISLGWFDGLPMLCNLLLGVFMLFGLSATLFGLKFEQEQDTIKLNQNLQSYQEKNK